jgi:hypothetical protein
MIRPHDKLRRAHKPRTREGKSSAASAQSSANWANTQERRFQFRCRIALSDEERRPEQSAQAQFDTASSGNDADASSSSMALAQMGDSLTYAIAD